MNFGLVQNPKSYFGILDFGLVQNPKSKIPKREFGFWISPNSKIQNPKFKIHIFGIWNLDFKVQNSKSKFQNPIFEFWILDFKIQNSKFKIQITNVRILASGKKRSELILSFMCLIVWLQNNCDKVQGSRGCNLLTCQ